MANTVNILGFTGGVNYGSPRDQLPASQMSAGKNWLVGKDGVLARRWGYLSSNMPGRWAAVDILTDRKTAGSTLIALTASDNRRIISAQITAADDYRRYYLYKTTGQSPEIDATEVAEVLQYLQVAGDNTLSAAMPLGGAAGYNFCYYDSSADYKYSLVDGVFNEANFLAVVDKSNQATAIDCHRAKCMTIFDGRVFLGGTYEKVNATDWVALPYRIRWSERGAFGQPDNWNDADPNISAGYDHTIADSSIVMNMASLDKALYVYMDNGLRVGYATQSVTAAIRFTAVNGRGIYACNALAVTESGHFYLGSDGRVYLNRGGVEPDAIGAAIDQQLFSSINETYKERIFAGHIPLLNAIYFAVPTGIDQWPRTLYLYFYRRGVWQIWHTPDYMYCSSGFDQVFGGRDKLITFSDSYTDDGGSAIDAVAITGDYILDLASNQRVQKLYFEAWSDGDTAIEVGWSENSAVTAADMTETVTINISGGWNRYQWNLDTGEHYKLRFMFRAVTDSVNIKLGRVWTELT